MKKGKWLIVLWITALVTACSPLTPRTAPQVTESVPTAKQITPSPATTITPSPTMTLSPTNTVDVLILSPDGTMRLQSPDWIYYEILNADGMVLWSFTYDNKFGVLEPGWNPFYWSRDGKYIYFTCYHGPDDSSTKFFGNAFTDGDCVFRFDVDTGKMIEVLPDIQPGYYAFSISPDENLLVYANQTETPVKLKLLDLNTNTERVLLTGDKIILEIGSFGWSPKMDKLIFSTLEILDDEKREYSIFMLDLKSLRTRILVENFGEWLAFKSWNEQGQIFYRDSNHGIWQFNLDSQALSLIATKTPWPVITRTPKP
jgi:hypothetical protein